MRALRRGLSQDGLCRLGLVPCLRDLSGHFRPLALRKMDTRHPVSGCSARPLRLQFFHAALGRHKEWKGDLAATEFVSCGRESRARYGGAL
jgi:hypothetical protein